MPCVGAYVCVSCAQGCTYWWAKECSYGCVRMVVGVDGGGHMGQVVVVALRLGGLISVGDRLGGCLFWRLYVRFVPHHSYYHMQCCLLNVRILKTLGCAPS